MKVMKVTEKKSESLFLNVGSVILEESNRSITVAPINNNLLTTNFVPVQFINRAGPSFG